MAKRYKVDELTINDTIMDLDYDKLTGLDIKPKNNIDYDGIVVNKAVIIDPSLIEFVLKKKNKRKIEAYLQYIIAILESDDTDGGTIDNALDELNHYKLLIKNNYSKYLEKKYIDLLLKKVSLIEHELKTKANLLKPVKEEKQRKSR